MTTPETISVAEMRELLADLPDDWRMVDESADARGSIQAAIGEHGPCIVVTP